MSLFKSIYVRLLLSLEKTKKLYLHLAAADLLVFIFYYNFKGKHKIQLQNNSI